MIWQARRDSNPQHPDLESDALPLELLACTNLHQSHRSVFETFENRLFCLFMNSVFSAESTIFIESQLIRSCPFILCCCIVSSFAFYTCKGNNYSHQQAPLRPLQNAPFCPISVSGSNFNPQNTQCIPVVKIFDFLELEQN